MKHLMLLSLLVLIGCDKTKFIEPTKSTCDRKFNYHDKIEVLKGKYTGYIGYVYKQYDNEYSKEPVAIILLKASPDGESCYLSDAVSPCDLTPTTKLWPKMVLHQEGME